MRTFLRLSAGAAMLALLILAAGAASAATPAHVNGGGTTTFGADLDGDGDIEASQFSLHVTIDPSGGVRGNFNCLMAGRSDILGLGLMAVRGAVASASIDGDTVTMHGTATVILTRASALFGAPAVKMQAPFTAVATAGGPGAGTLRLTVLGAFDGGPGDLTLGNGNYDLPTETLVSGQIGVR